MRVKKFTAPTVAEAIRRVKDELGDDAVIVHTRECRRPLLGLFGRPHVEVTAGAGLATAKPSSRSPEPSESNPLLASPAAKPQREDRVDLSGTSPREPHIASPQLKALAQSVLAKQGKTVETWAPEDFRQETREASVVLDRRLEALEGQLNRLTGLIERVAGGKTETVSAENPDPWKDFLISRGIENSLADEILAAVPPPVSRMSLRSELIRRLPVAGPIVPEVEGDRPKVVMLVGPTGVGKTTTLAKIAPGFTHPHSGVRKKVVFVTADLFRIAAVEQLQKYSEILRVPLEVVYAANEAAAAIQRQKDADLILIDTGGTGQRNESQVMNLVEIAQACRPLEVHLVLSATTKNSDLTDIIERFRALEPQRLLITKLDESTKFGNLLNATVCSQLPISYVTTGQLVPEDIEVARSERLVDLILGEDESVEDLDSSPSDAEDSVSMAGGVDHA